MKKFLALLIAIIMSIGLCSACGSGKTMSGTVTPKDIIDSEEIVLGYLAESASKDEVPRGIIVFQTGTALMFDDTEYTMGDFSQMTDEKILSALYKEEVGNAVKSSKNGVKSLENEIKSYNDSIENCEKNITKRQNEITALQAELAEEQKRVESYNWYTYCVGCKGDFPQTFKDYSTEKRENKWFDLRERDWIEAIWARVGKEEYSGTATLLEAWDKYKSDNPDVTEIKLTTMNYISKKNFSVNDERIDDVLNKFDTIRMPDQIGRVNTNFEQTKLEYEEKVTQVQTQITELEDKITDYNKQITKTETTIEEKNQEITELESLEKLEDKTIYPIVLDLITDDSGNELQTEYIMLLGKDDIYLGLPLNAKATGVPEPDIKIYDSSYCGYALDMGDSNINANLFFRSESKNLKLKFDTLDTKDVLIDVTDLESILKGVDK